MIEPLERRSLGVQIGLGVVIGRIEADMPQPASDHSDIHARSYQVDSGRVPKAVRRYVL